MKAIINGTILLPDQAVNGKVLLFGEKITGISDAVPDGCEVVDAGGLYVSPGFVDVHIHGYLGADCSDGDAGGLRAMARGILRNGVTSFLPTTMTVPWGELERAFGTIRGMMEESRTDGFGGAEILGCHAEGPFINPKKKGAQAESAILPPEAERLLPWADIIRLVTLAPEMPGAMECIRTLAGAMHVSIGHTDADYDTALQALRAGADHFTHTFNAMTGLTHRQPGVAGAALTSDAWCELIADTFHVHPAVYPILRACAKDRLVLITDCTRAGGLADGEYSLGGQPIYVRGIECRLADGTIAGSVLHMNDAVRNWHVHAGVPLYEAVACASQHPAASIGLADRKGSLLPGRDADLLLMDPACAVQAAWVRGKRAF